MYTTTLCVGSDGHEVLDLPPAISEIEIEASAVQDPRAKSVVTYTVNLMGQGTSNDWFQLNQSTAIFYSMLSS